MKKIILSGILLMALINGGCNKHVDNQCRGAYSGSMTVVKDCTGAYLRFDGKDYLICNKELIAGYNNGDKITAGFNKVNACSRTDGGIVCMMYHQHEGYAEITCIQ